MAPARRKSAPRASRGRRGGGRSSRNTAPAPAEKTDQDVFNELAEEVERAEPSQDRPLKRRKTTKGVSKQATTPAQASSAEERAQVDVDALFYDSEPNDDEFEDVEIEVPKPHDDEISLDEDDEAMEWEDVGEQNDTLTLMALDNDETAPGEDTGDLSIVISKDESPAKKAARAKRKGLTAADKERRLVAHKLHVASLLSFVFMRNSWCNDSALRDILKRVLPAKTIHLFHSDRNVLQAQRTLQFVEGLKAAVERWRSIFEVTQVGMERPLGGPLENFKLDENIETIVDRTEFRQAAKDRAGSADTGAQLFCALLRSVGVDARLVCSLQVLGLSAAGPNSTTAEDPQLATIYADATDQKSDLEKRAAEKVSKPSGTPKLTPPRLSRVGRPPLNAWGIKGKDQASSRAIKSSVELPIYPVFWVEAFNEASQKWIPVDPIVTATVGKPSIIEPPMNNDKNIMTYAIAFEEDGAATDVTRRYAHQYMAKTRRRRVEYIDGGDVWLRKLMRRFKRRRPADRDQIESSELDQKEAHEGMPRNIEDFKGHPIYVLERHLKQNEIIHPRHIAGKVQVSRSSSGTEPIYRRSNVHIARSAEKWFRLGREVRVGEQAMKYAKPRKSRARTPEDGNDELDSFGEPLGTGLYAKFQTKQYVPPRVIDGRLPKNAFGNIDVYVPSMIPRGATHVRSPLAAKAARLVNVDYAEAKVGFRFKGRRGEPVFDGAIVADEYAESVRAVVDGFEYAKEIIEAAQRTREVLRMWKKFYKGLMILQHVERYKGDDDEKGFQEEFEQMDVDEEEESEIEDFGAGGFFMDADAGPPALPTAMPSRTAAFREQPHPAPTPFEADELGGGFVPDHDGTLDGGGFLPPSSTGGGFVPRSEDGGFIPEDMEGGGFLPDAETSERNQQSGSPTKSSEDSDPHEEPEAPKPGDSKVEETGGGFTIDEAVHESSIPPEAEIDSDPEIPQEILLESLRTKQEFEEAKQNLSENDATVDPAVSEDVKRSSRSPDAKASANVADNASPQAPPSPAAPPSPRAVAEDQDSSDDRGSLLSHDPEDDDLEPDWLE